jgi:hypothetical protein
MLGASMKKSMIYPLFIILCFAFMNGCAGAPKPKIVAPDFLERSKALKKIGVLSAGSYIFELGAGGSKELNKDWSKQAELNLEKISVDQLKLAGYDAIIMKVDANTNAIVKNFNDIQRDNLTRYVYSARKIEAPNSDTVLELLNREGLDALVLVRGIDHVSSSGRQALKVAAAILGAGVSSGIAHLELAMIDKSPAFVYYSHKYEDGKDLRTESGTSYLFNEIMIDLKELRGL